MALVHKAKYPKQAIVKLGSVGLDCPAVELRRSEATIMGNGIANVTNQLCEVVDSKVGMGGWGCIKVAQIVPMNKATAISSQDLISKS